MTYTPYLVPVSVKGIVIENAKVWLRKNERNEWELPGGKIDPGEQPNETVVRELLEELGFSVKVIDVIDAHMYTIQKSIDESLGVLVLCYLCSLTNKTGKFEIMGEAGKSEFKAFPLEKVGSLNMPDFYKEAIKKASQQ
jgi:8-oxo-dGTP pyrophosphatase MutT (NUDIX family)